MHTKSTTKLYLITALFLTAPHTLYGMRSDGVENMERPSPQEQSQQRPNIFFNPMFAGQPQPDTRPLHERIKSAGGDAIVHGTIKGVSDIIASGITAAFIEFVQRLKRTPELQTVLSQKNILTQLASKALTKEAQEQYLDLLKQVEQRELSIMHKQTQEVLEEKSNLKYLSYLAPIVLLPVAYMQSKTVSTPINAGVMALTGWFPHANS